jgi:hypothetical protein
MRMVARAKALVVALAGAAICLTSVGAAQVPWMGRGSDEATSPLEGNVRYDGRFMFVRVPYRGPGGEYQFGRGRAAGWSHDYPRGEVHFMKILDEITNIHPRMDGSNILALDDPALFNFPIAYMSEPGAWQPGESEVQGLRAYLNKGGFIIFDDFRGFDWENLEQQMKRVLPDLQFVELDGTHPIFHSFFEIDSPLELAPPYGGLPPSYWGLFEGNDPTRRLVAIANRNNDISEYWEWSDTGFVPIDLSNEAYKFGVNYVIYGMTH